MVRFNNFKTKVLSNAVLISLGSSAHFANVEKAVSALQKQVQETIVVRGIRDSFVASVAN